MKSLKLTTSTVQEESFGSLANADPDPNIFNRDEVQRLAADLKTIRETAPIWHAHTIDKLINILETKV